MHDVLSSGLRKILCHCLFPFSLKIEEKKSGTIFQTFLSNVDLVHLKRDHSIATLIRAPIVIIITKVYKDMYS